MNLFTSLQKNSAEIEKQLGYEFKNKTLLAQAFVHRSFFNEHRDLVTESNERLEFLGDAVLGLIISEYLYTQLPREEEGYLSRLRSQIVDAPTCSQLVQKLRVERHVLLGKGERLNEGRGRETIYADLFEALIGAVYLDGGLEEAEQLIRRYFLPEIEGVLKAPFRNWKADLQDYSQKKYQKPPVYKVLQESGPDHSKLFQVAVYLEELEVGQGTGSSKKEAEMHAAQHALRRLHG